MMGSISRASKDQEHQATKEKIFIVRYCLLELSWTYKFTWTSDVHANVVTTKENFQEKLPKLQ